MATSKGKHRPTRPDAESFPQSQLRHKTRSATVDGGGIKLSLPARLFRWDSQMQSFAPAVEEGVEAQLVEASGISSIRARSLSGEVILETSITANLSFRGIEARRAFNWSVGNAQSSEFHSFVFDHCDRLSLFVSHLEAIRTNQMPEGTPDGLDAVERDAILTSRPRVRFGGTQEYSEDDDEAVALSEDDDDDSGLSCKMISSKTHRDRAGNSRMTAGHKDGRVFVVRGSSVDIFKWSSDDLSRTGSLPSIKTSNGSSFSPTKIMLHDQEASMICMKADEPHSLFRVDLSRGDVVDEWKVHDDISVTDFAPRSKFAQTTAEKTIVGTSQNALFRIDPRVSGSKLVDRQVKQYASKTEFFTVATTSQGYAVVGSKKGEIRLFDAIGKNAKTLLPSMGDPLIGVDTTADGRWVIATYQRHLLLFNTVIKDGTHAGSLGFSHHLSTDNDSAIRRLQLEPKDAAHVGLQVPFGPARFNMSPDSRETWIVTSCGKFVIAWDFESVCAGKRGAYVIRSCEDIVVQNQFKFNDDQNIVLAFQDAVGVLRRKPLRKPASADSPDSRQK